MVTNIIKETDVLLTGFEFVVNLFLILMTRLQTHACNEHLCMRATNISTFRLYWCCMTPPGEAVGLFSSMHYTLKCNISQHILYSTLAVITEKGGGKEQTFFSSLHPPPTHSGSILSSDTLKDVRALEINFPRKHKRGNVAYIKIINS